MKMTETPNKELWWTRRHQTRITGGHGAILRRKASTINRQTIHLNQTLNLNQTQTHIIEFFNKKIVSPKVKQRETKQRLIAHSVDRENEITKRNKRIQGLQLIESLRLETFRTFLLGAVHKKKKKRERKHRRHRNCITEKQRVRRRMRLLAQAKSKKISVQINTRSPNQKHTQVMRQWTISPLLLTNTKPTQRGFFKSPPIQNQWRKEQELTQLLTQTPNQNQWSIKQRLDHLAKMTKQRQIILTNAEKRKQDTKDATWERRALIRQKQSTNLLRWLTPPSLITALRAEYIDKLKNNTQDKTEQNNIKAKPTYQSTQARSRWQLTNTPGIMHTPKQKKRQTTLEKWSFALPRILGEESPINISNYKTTTTESQEWPPLYMEEPYKEPTEQPQQNAQRTAKIKKSIFSPRAIQTQQYKHAHQIKVATLNCPGIAAISAAGRIKRRVIRQYCVQNRIDILALQETHTTCELSELSSFFSYKTYSSTVSASSRGVAFIIFNHKIKILGVTDPKDGMMYSIRIEFKERKLTVVNFYSPPDKTTQQTLFVKYMASWDNTKPILFLGDWNFLDHPHDDTVGRETDETLRPPQSFEYLRRLYGLVDAADIYPSTVRMTRWNVEHSSGTRLDRIYTTGNMVEWIIGLTNEAIPCKLPTSKRHTISDHNIISITLSASSTPRGEGYWKLNTQILKSVQLQQKLQVLMNDFITQNKNNPSTFKQYDQLKALLRGTLRDWSADRAKKIHQETQDLKAKIEEYTLIIENEQKKEEWKKTAEMLLQARRRLAQINQEIAQGAWIRSRAKWDFQADKSTKMYFNLEKSYSTKKHIAQIKDEQGKLTTHPGEIVEVFRQFYQNLYSYREIDTDCLDDLLKNLSLSTDLMTSKRMAKLVNKKEIQKAIKITKRGSSPGPDGLPGEFYKLFPQWWGRILETVYKEIARTGRIPHTMTESFITLLPKKFGDILNAANWRPISLLNSDYKILTKVWANRLNLVMQEGIGLHQTGFIPGRDIRENILLIQTMIDKMSKDSEFKQAGILLLDLAKAYDRISHESIWAVIEKLNFPQHGLQFMKAIYRNPVSWILCNGFLSKKVQIKSGVRQGCPLSPQIFTLVAELLCQNIIKDTQFYGYKVHGNEFVKVVGYADDMAIPLTSIRDCIQFLATLKKYEVATASLTNKAKTYFVVIGDQSPIAQYLINRGFSIKYPGTLTRYLGIPVGVKPNYNSVWDKLLADIKKSLRLWNKICSNVYGRALILKSKGLSKLWYVASMLPLTPYACNKITEIQKECTAFFWAYKGHKLRYANLMKPPQWGGFNLWDLKQKIISLQLKWMTKLENPTYQALWKTNAITILNTTQRKFGYHIPLTHSTKRLTYPTASAILNNLLEHWHQTLDRSPQALKAGDWVASLTVTEAPHWVYKVKRDLVWATNKKGQMEKIQNIPIIDLEWFPQNNTRNDPSTWTEKLHTLVPVTVRIENQKITRAIATFPPITFMKHTTNKIQQISRMTNKDYYIAVQSWNKKPTIKQYKWPNIGPKRLKDAFIHNHHGRVGASIKQTRWMVLTHCLPVGSRLHKINNQMDKKCPNCNAKETIRHCLFTCTAIHYIWAWFKHMWESITADDISDLDADEWICNDHESSFPEQLRETINIIIHRIWINRNKKIFNNRELIRRRPAMLIDIAAHWNRHIRAQLHQQKMRQEQAIFYRQTTPYVKGWKTLWQRILHVPPIYTEWARLQNTEGDNYTQLLLHNPIHTYNKTGVGHTPIIEWKQSKNKSRKRQASTAGIAVGAHRHPQKTHTQNKTPEKQTQNTTNHNEQKVSPKNAELIQHISDLFIEIQHSITVKQTNQPKKRKAKNQSSNFNNPKYQKTIEQQQRHAPQGYNKSSMEVPNNTHYIPLYGTHKHTTEKTNHQRWIYHHTHSMNLFQKGGTAMAQTPNQHTLWVQPQNKPHEHTHIIQQRNTHITPLAGLSGDNELIVNEPIPTFNPQTMTLNGPGALSRVVTPSPSSNLKLPQHITFGSNPSSTRASPSLLHGRGILHHHTSTSNPKHSDQKGTVTGSQLATTTQASHYTVATHITHYITVTPTKGGAPKTSHLPTPLHITTNGFHKLDRALKLDTGFHKLAQNQNFKADVLLSPSTPRPTSTPFQTNTSLQRIGFRPKKKHKKRQKRLQETQKHKKQATNLHTWEAV